MDNVQRCSFLWSSDSDPSRAPLNQTENDSASLLLLLLNNIGYTQYLHSEEQDYKVYEIELKNDRDIAKLKFPDEVEIGKYEYKVNICFSHILQIFMYYLHSPNQSILEPSFLSLNSLNEAIYFLKN
ncbi:hypothetical protein RF11_01809 [Thelohanellus kitauei]|uniref:Uncharacterized protein n=1 Tax=Thelohanellus kitauei TaxID=669202 RepID=A0A0C2NCZ9_THEKT|nr:hypothetical protein RF11_01809 [Thelohanellus kitauei]